MRIDCYFTHQSCAERHFMGRDAVVIDVLRATSSIITALQAGATAVIPVAEIADALEWAVAYPGSILAGERNGERLEGFAMGNSPSEFTREAVAGRLIISCSTNGTAAIIKAAAARRVWLAAFINAQAVIQKLLYEDVGDLAILCSGSMGDPSLDDILVAGALLHQLNGSTALEMNDSALLALSFYKSCIPLGMLQALKLAAHAQKLIRFQHSADVEYCAQENISNTVPWFKQGDGRIYG